MIKFKVSGNAKPLLGLGISAENVKRLKAGQPIKFDASEMGIDAEIMIFYGETEDDLRKSIQPYISNETEIHDKRKGIH